MADTNWTQAQLDAINIRNSNVLVSAAAGSGKTAVLIERVLRLLSDPTDPADLDEMVIMTFTEAAAKGMVEKLYKKLRKAVKEQPSNNHLKRQLLKVHTARICTIDALCGRIVRENFQSLDIDPMYRIMDEAEKTLLEQEVLGEVLEEAYTDNSPAFILLVESYMNKDDSDLEELILELKKFAESHPEPEKWLQDNAQQYKNASDESAEYVKHLKKFKGQVMAALIKKCKHIKDEISVGGLHKHETLMDGFADKLELIGAEDMPFDEVKANIEGLLSGWKNNPSYGKNDEIDNECKNRVNELRNSVKTTLKNLKDDYYSADWTDVAAATESCADVVEELVNITLKFMECLSEKKAERSVATHSDVEHWALKVLYEYNEDKSLKTDEEGRPVYTAAARQYAEEIREIIVDEYQDTNFIQEYIVRALSGGKPNVFMVGDVKQSIYRFRQACPELFLEKYHTYKKEMPGDTDDGRAGTTIVFDRNFRSRKEVVDITNFVFNQFMIEEIGGINYEDGNGLVYGEQYDNVIDDREQTGTAEAADPARTEAAAGNAASQAEVCADTLAAGQADTCAAAVEGMRATAFLRAQKSYTPEIYFYQGSGDTGHMAEAEKVADAITNVVGKLDVCFEGPDGKKHLKKASFSDIAILTRVNDNPDIERALENYGIPYFKKTKKGFYKSIEIKLVLNLLRIIDNPRQDIPMAAVLTSPIACFSADDLAILKINCKGSFSLYKALKDAKAEFDKYNADSEKSPCAGTQEEAENAADTAGAVSASDAGGASLSNAEISCFTKAAEFIEKLENWRERSVYMDLPGFISYLFRDSEILNIVGAMPGGTGRRANVEFFRTQAANYTATSYSGLFGYLRYLDALIKADVEAGNQIEMSGADAVQIMTMHGSKGLEFPVCIVPLLGKTFNNDDHNIIVDRELGIGVDTRNIETHKTKATLIKNVIAQKNKQEGMAESLRLLYVAMTRAQEKLILTGSYRYYTSQCRQMSIPNALLENHMDRDSILDSACFQVLMSKALVNHKNGEPIAALGGFAQESSHHLYNVPVEFYMEAEEAKPAVLADPADLPDMDAERLKVTDFIEHASDKAYDFDDLDYFFSFVYDHEAAVHMPVKVTASGLEDKSIQRDEDTVLQTGISYYAGEKNLYEYIPEDEFSDSEERACEKPEKAAAGAGSPAPGSKKQGNAAGSKSAGKKFLSGNQYSERGNAYHRFMELYDYSLSDAELLSSDEELLKEIDSNMEKMTSSGRLSEEWAEYIEKDKILTFLKNDIGLRMRRAYAAGNLKREQQFVMGMDKDEEFLLLQGIIDAYFIEDGKIILLDYKTDKPKAEEAFIKTYKPQADAYARALEAAFSMNVGEKLLYSFSLGRTINIQ